MRPGGKRKCCHRFFPEPRFEQVADSILARLHSHYDFDGWRDHGHAAGISLRVQDAWTFDDNVKRIACNEHIIALFSRLYGRQAWPFQTLNFPIGAQQHFHTDSIHFSSCPERFMCGVWVAMEDIDETNGPLMYFPGSHRWPIYTNEHIGKCVAEEDGTPTQAIYEAMWRDLIAAHDVKPEYFHAKKGQALIRAANLMHGGTRQIDPARTRWSQVTHYFFDDCAYYTPMMSDPFYGSIAFRNLTNVATGEQVPNRVAGHAVPRKFVDTTTPGQTNCQENETFDPALYLLANPDVAAAGIDPAMHYIQYGRNEKRKMRP